MLSTKEKKFPNGKVQKSFVNKALKVRHPTLSLSLGSIKLHLSAQNEVGDGMTI